MLPERLLVVDAERQLAVWLEDGKAAAAWQVSTARAGIGGVEGSFRTPPGWHRITSADRQRCGARHVFVSREPTGDTWRGEAREDDLILTRILTLEGLEDGVNRGRGRNSLARYIYLHGTNHEGLLGRPVSHGCVRFSNAGVCELFARLREGDFVFVAAPDMRSIHARAARAAFTTRGWGGAGMSALAQFQSMTGGIVSGSDRAFDHGERAVLRPGSSGSAHRSTAGRQRPRSRLRRAHRFNGRRRSGADVVAARALDIPIIHRSELLAHFVAGYRSIAVTGTSGKSTVTAMIFAVLSGAGRDPSVITGADLPEFRRKASGQRLAGRSDLLVSRPTRATARWYATRPPSA